MKTDEIELEKLVKDFEEEKFNGQPPLFELFITTFSLLLTVTLFIYPEMLNKGFRAYDILLQVMPSYLWGLSFFTASMLKGTGLLLDIKSLRIIGLILSAVFYFILSLSYAVDFPAISSIMYGVVAVFSVFSIQQVKHTSIINLDGDE